MSRLCVNFLSCSCNEHLHHCILYEIVYGHIVWIFIIILNRSIPLLSAQGLSSGVVMHCCIRALSHMQVITFLCLCRFINNLSVFIELLKCDKLLLLVPIHVFFCIICQNQIYIFLRIQYAHTLFHTIYNDAIMI